MSDRQVTERTASSCNYDVPTSSTFQVVVSRPWAEIKITAPNDSLSSDDIFVLDSDDGSYYQELPLSDATQDSNNETILYFPELLPDKNYTLKHKHYNDDKFVEIASGQSFDVIANVKDETGDTHAHKVVSGFTPVHFHETNEATIAVTDALPDKGNASPVKNKWIYVFRCEKKGENRSVYVSEYYADENEQYKKIPLDENSGDSRSPAGTSRDVILLPHAKDPIPSYYFLLSSFQLPIIRLEKIRTDLQETGKCERLMRTYMIDRETSSSSWSESKTCMNVYLIDYFSLALKYHTKYIEALSVYMDWMAKTSATKQLNDIVHQLSEASEGLAKQLGKVGSLDAGLAWKRDYVTTKSRLKTKYERACAELVLCLQYPGYEDALKDCLTGSEEIQEIGIDAYGEALQDIYASKVGQNYLDRIFDKSEIKKKFLPENLPVQIGPDKDPTEEELQKLYNYAEEALKVTEGEDDTFKKGFNAFDQIFGKTRKICKGSFSILEAFSKNIEKAFKTAEISVPFVTSIYTRIWEIKPTIALNKKGEFTIGEALTVKTIRTPVVSHKRIPVYEIREVPNMPSRITGHKLYSRFSNSLILINVVVKGISLKYLLENINAKNTLETINLFTDVAGDIISKELVQKALSKKLGQETAEAAATKTVLFLARAGLVLDVILGTWAVGEEVAQKDYDGAAAQAFLALGSIVMSYGGVMVASSAASGTSASLLVGSLVVPVGWVFVIGLGLVLLGFFLVSIWDDNVMELWLQKTCLWGKEYDDQQTIKHALKLVQSQDGLVEANDTYDKDISKQTSEFYKIIFDFSVSMYPETLTDGFLDFDSSNNVDLLIIDIERATAGAPLPKDATLSIDVQASNGSGTVNFQSPLSDMDKIKRHFLPEAKQPDDGKFEPLTSKNLVFRLYDSSQGHYLQQKEKGYKNKPVGFPVSGLKENTSLAAMGTTWTCVVRLNLSGKSGAAEIVEKANYKIDIKGPSVM